MMSKYGVMHFVCEEGGGATSLQKEKDLYEILVYVYQNFGRPIEYTNTHIPVI